MSRLFRLWLLGSACALACWAQVASRENSVVVTGSFDPIGIDELDRAVSSLPIRSNELLLNSWVDALRLDPSVDLRSRAPNGVQTDVSIRGGTFGQTLVLLNGIRINDVQSGHHNMDLPVPLASIDHVEILKGSGSALYGSDAVGGVVNIITRAPEATELVLRTAAGNFGVNQQSGALSLVAPKITEQLSFSRDFSSGFQFDRDYRNLAFGSVTHALSGLGASDIVMAYDDRPYGADQFYGNYPSWEDTKTWFASFRQDLGKNTEAAFAYRRHSDLFVLYRDRPQVYANHHSDEAYEASLRRTNDLGPNTRLHYGGEYYNESLASTNLGTRQRNRGAAFASLDVRALRRFSFSIGAREDFYGSISGQFNPNAAAGFWVTSKIRLRGGVSRAFRLPTYTDLYYQDPANFGNPTLKPEHAWSYEGGVDWQIASGLRAEATLWERRDRDGIDYVRTSLTDPWRAQNFDRLNFTGFEGSLRASFARAQSLRLSYAAMRGVEDSLGALYSKYAFNFPSQSATAEYQAALGRLLLRTRMGAEQRIQRDPYAVWDVYFAWSRDRIRPFVQFTNLTDTRYEEILGVAMPGRAVVGGVEFHILR
jgi:iron complex outermembrane receptor protein